ncbi:MAG: hypothetical protein ABI967_15840 [bacterium]
MVAKQIIEDVLDVSRIITGKLRIGPVPLKLVPVIQAAIDVVGPPAWAKQITVAIMAEPGELSISGDAERLQQVA